MKHETSYIFSPDDIHSVADAACVIRKLGWNSFTYHKFKMADGTEHQFINTNDGYIEMPDLNAALAFVVGDIYMLKEFVDAGYLIKEADDA